MKIVIQCAGKKIHANSNAGFRSSDNRRIKFVAHPELAPHSDSYFYVRPDDLFDGTQTWRTHLLNYNMEYQENPSRLLPAYRLYFDKTYRKLVERFGIEQVFILSAGWGLLRPDFLTPDYDITFSGLKKAKHFSQRTESDSFSDFCFLPDDGDSITFLGGQNYLPLFVKLTADFIGSKTIFCYSTPKSPLGPGFTAKIFETNRTTNWHYECAQMLVDGEISP